MSFDSTECGTELGWKPDVDFEEGVDEVVQWVTEYWGETAAALGDADVRGVGRIVITKTTE